MPSKPKVYFVQNIKFYRSVDEEAAKDRLDKLLADDRIEIVQPPPSDEHLDHAGIEAYAAEHIEGASSIVLNSWDYTLPLELFKKAGPSLKAVTVSSAGYNQVQTKELKAMDVKFANAPNGLVEATAQTGVALALWAMRDFKALEKICTDGDWARNPHPGFQGMLGQGLAGKTVGVLGMGKIGSLLIPLLAPWGIKRFLYTASRPGKPASNDEYGHIRNSSVPVEVAESIDQLARESDLLFLCAPLNDSTRHIVNADFLRKMKKTATLVNIGRGALVDSKALLDALKSEQIFSAGLDVLEDEWTKDVAKHDELIQHPRCVVLPHVGSTIGSFRIIAVAIAVENAILGALGERMPNEVPI